MKKNTLICVLLSLFVIAPTDARDTLYSDDVVVTANRISQDRKEVLADVTVIDREEIERAGQSTFVELLQRQPGIEISTSGGAGNVSSVFLRGTNSDHIVVLIDGLRINSATIGTTSLENIPLSQIERIEILRGPASSLYGADAIGGVIQLFTKRSEENIKVNLFSAYGSYNTSIVQAGINGGDNNTHYGINLSRFETKGFSAQRVNTAIDADNDGYRNVSATAYLEHSYRNGHSLSFQIFQNKGRNEYDSGNNFNNTGNQTLLSYGFTSKNQITSVWQSILKLGESVDEFYDQSQPSFFNLTGQSHFYTKQRQLAWQNNLSLPAGTLTLAYDRLEQKVRSSSAYDKTSRYNNALLASYLYDFGSHSMRLSLRRDHNSQFGDWTTGGLAYGYQFTPQWKISASYGTAFKSPSFNQLYFSNFGNPNLNPEKSYNREIAIRYETNVARTSVTIFSNTIKDLIQYSGPPSGFNPVNVAKANINGITFDGSWFIDEHWTIRGNFTVQSPRSKDTDLLLARRSQRFGTLNLDWQSGPFQLGIETSATSRKFNDATNTKNIRGYTLLNLTSAYTFAEDWKLEARANNILNKDYVSAYVDNSATSAPYGAPGASLFVGLRWHP